MSILHRHIQLLQMLLRLGIGRRGDLGMGDGREAAGEQKKQKQCAPQCDSMRGAQNWTVPDLPVLQHNLTPVILGLEPNIMAPLSYPPHID
ncbi:MAG TPA: hypothetical protein VFN62_11780 [Acidobacteriaceae bacterium]|nr:hypothetical protein [Acidobacteriaceae bacterium]